MFQECSRSSMGSEIILGMLKIIFLELANATTASFWTYSSCILGRSNLFGKGYESILGTLGAFEEKVGFSTAPARPPAWSSPPSQGGHLLLSLLGCCITLWHVVSSNSELCLKFSCISYHSFRRQCRLQCSESERKVNWLFEKFSTYSEGFQKALGECSRRTRCDIKPNKPFELHSERIWEGFQEDA